MIKLDRMHLTRLTTAYKNKMRDELLSRYTLAAVNHPIPANPFTGNEFTAIFKNATGAVNIALINDLLTKPLDAVCADYPQIDYYMKVCRLVYYSAWQIDNELEKNSETPSNANRREFRRRYVEKYSNGNPWLNNLLSDHPEYAQNMICFNAFIKDARQKLVTLNNFLSEIVDYKMMEPDYRHALLTRMGIEVCPYCNRQYITKFTSDDGKLKSMADLDHFYPKSIFQLLSLSLFNFVPSCQHCNSRFKLARSMEIMYPYEQGFEDNAFFQVMINSNTTIGSLTGQNTDFDLELVVLKSWPDSAPIHNSMNMFHINEVYQSHKEYVRELLYKKQAYASSYKEELLQLFKSMKLTEADIHLFLYGNRLLPEELHKKPLSKLTYDIILQDQLFRKS